MEIWLLRCNFDCNAHGTLRGAVLEKNPRQRPPIPIGGHCCPLLRRNFDCGEQGFQSRLEPLQVRLATPPIPIGGRCGPGNFDCQERQRNDSPEGTARANTWRACCRSGPTQHASYSEEIMSDCGVKLFVSKFVCSRHQR